MQKNKTAFTQGLALSEYLNLFHFFLTQTPEGKQVCSQLEQDWQNTCTQLQQQGVLKGEILTCQQWLGLIREKLRQPPQKAVAKKTKTKTKKVSSGKKTQYFKGI